MAAPAPPTLPDMNSGPRNFITTDKDHGGVALVICTLMATWVVLCFMVRMYMRATVSGPFGRDDVFCSLATIFGVIQMIVSSAAVSFGFGKNLELLTDAQILKASKAVYAAQLLYIVTNALTKCTVALLLARLVFIKNRVQACYAVLTASCLWGFGSFIAEAIRCTQHHPWSTVGQQQCSNLYLAWQVITAFNILIEICLLAIPVWLVWGLQTDLTKKATVVSVFWLRFPVIVAAGLRLHFLRQTIGSSQPLFNGVIPFSLLNIEMHYGLMAATMPTLKPFVSAFNTAWGTYDTQGISGYGQNSSGNSYAMRSLSNRRGSNAILNNGISPLASRNRDRQESTIGAAGGTHKYAENVTRVSSPHCTAVARSKSPDARSSSSQRMIIRQTVDMEVHYEDGDVKRKEATMTPTSRGASASIKNESLYDEVAKER